MDRMHDPLGGPEEADAAARREATAKPDRIDQAFEQMEGGESAGSGMMVGGFDFQELLAIRQKHFPRLHRWQETSTDLITDLYGQATNLRVAVEQLTAENKAQAARIKELEEKYEPAEDKPDEEAPGAEVQG
jgi:hypothetical protein